MVRYAVPADAVPGERLLLAGLEVLSLDLRDRSGSADLGLIGLGPLDDPVDRHVLILVLSDVAVVADVDVVVADVEPKRSSSPGS